MVGDQDGLAHAPLGALVDLVEPRLNLGESEEALRLADTESPRLVRQAVEEGVERNEDALAVGYVVELVEGQFCRKAS